MGGDAMNLRPILQSESAECGLACLAILPGAHELQRQDRLRRIKSMNPVPLSLTRGVGLRSQPKTQRMGNFKHGCKARVAVARQSFVKAFATHASVTRQLRHATRAGDGAQRLCYERGVVTRLCEAGVKVERHVLFGFQVLRAVPFFKFDRAHYLAFQLTRQGERGCDVGLLRGFVATHEQYDDFCATLFDVDPVARTKVNPQLGNAFAHRLDVTKISILYPINSGLDAALGLSVTQGAKPIIERFCSQYRKHNTHCIPFDTCGRLVGFV